MNKTLKDFMLYRKMNSLTESAIPNFTAPQQYNPNSIYILAAPGSYTYKFALAQVTDHMTYLDYNEGRNKPVIVDWGDGMRDNRSSHTYYDSNEPRIIEIINGVGLLSSTSDSQFMGGLDNEELTPFDKENTIGALHVCTFRDTVEDNDEWAPLFGLFQGCKNLTYVAPNLLELCTDRTKVEHLFSGCTSLTDVPVDLFAGFDLSQAYTDTVFKLCPNLKQNPLVNNQYAQTKYPYKYRSGDPDFDQDY